MSPPVTNNNSLSLSFAFFGQAEPAIWKIKRTRSWGPARRGTSLCGWLVALACEVLCFRFGTLVCFCEDSQSVCAVELQELLNYFNDYVLCNKDAFVSFKNNRPELVVMVCIKK